MFACELKDAYGKIPTELPEQFQNKDGEIIKLHGYWIQSICCKILTREK